MTTTTTHTTPTLTHDVPAAGHRRGRWALVAGAAVVAATAIGVVVANDDTEPREQPAQGASDERRAAVLAELAEIARAQGVTGLSPLSLAPIDRSVAAPTIVDRGSIRAVEHRAEQTMLDQGSIRAVEHRTAGPRG